MGIAPREIENLGQITGEHLLFHNLLRIQTIDVLVNAGCVKLEIADRKCIGCVYTIDSIVIREQDLNAISLACKAVQAIESKIVFPIFGLLPYFLISRRRIGHVQVSFPNNILRFEIRPLFPWRELE